MAVKTSPTVPALQVEVDVIEIVEAGIEQLFSDPQERLTALYEVAEILQRRSPATIGGEIKRRLASERAREVLEAGLCPHCVSEITSHKADAGTRVIQCPQCGDL